ncbi:MAG: ABC transporter permease [Ruthenibacterium sp.]|nr:ABC transporter permease [Oscillospiraceae bacterium]
MNKKQKTPLLQKQGFTSFMGSVLAILCGLAVGFIVLLISNPANAVNGFISILTGAFSDMKNLGQVFYSATPIILTGLSVGFANKTGLFNIGGPGQFVVGAYVAVLIGVKCTFIPGPLLWLACLAGAMLAGALWGFVPGFLKAVCNVNEVIACIMMNYIGMYGVNFLVVETIFDSQKNQSLPVAANANAPKLGMDQIFRSGASASSVNAGIFVAILAGIIIYFLIEKTKFGYELKACGYNRDAAKYAGINEKRSIILSMAIAGSLCALGGACLYLAGAGKGIEVVDTLAAEGFNGIPVALLGLNNPIGIIFAGLFMAYLNQGGFNMQLYGFAPQVIEIIIAVIIYFAAFSLLLRGLVSRVVKRAGKNKTPGENANAEPGKDMGTVKGGGKE